MKALKHISFVFMHCNMAMQSTHLIQQSSFEVKLFFLLSSSDDSQSYQLLLYNVQQDLCWELLYFEIVKKLANLLIFHNMKWKFVVMKSLHMKHQLLILQLQFDVSTHFIYISFKISTFLDKFTWFSKLPNYCNVHT